MNTKLQGLKLHGALTGRPYPFTIRPWEYLYKNSIDCTSSFGQPLRAGIANNKVRRFLPNLIINEDDTPWINDKTRFSFEGLMSGNALKQFLSKKNRKKKKINKRLIQIILILFYFYDHLNSHFFKISSFIFVFGTTVSLELVSLLLFTFHKYSFLKLRTTEVLSNNNDFELNFQVNASLVNLTNLLKSDLCLLIGINTRYEASYLNLKLRKRYIKSDFTIVSLSSLLDLTFPIFLLGSVLKIFNSLIEGNSLINQIFKNANYPILILNSDYFRRHDSKSIFILIEILKSYTCFGIKNWNGLNILNSSLNDVGINSLNHFSVIKTIDFINFNAFYFINTPLYVSNIKKLLELKILNFFLLKKKNKVSIKTILNQSSVIQNNFWLTKHFKNNYNLLNYYYLPTKSFFETYEVYRNAEGFIKKSVNLIVSNVTLKDNWKFLRRVFIHTRKKLVYMKDIKNNKFIYFKSNNLFKFRNFISLQLCPIKVFTDLGFYHLSNNIPFSFKINFFFFFLYKNFNTKVKFWLEDFYIGSRDLYSRHSKTMIQCSSLLRQEKLNFN